MQININNAPLFRIDTIAKFSFIIFLFFTFFGTSLPFQETASVEATSNPVNQIVFSVVLFLSMISLFSKREQLVNLIISEKFLSLFLLWCLISIIWSQYSFISLKRLIQVLSAVTASLAVLLHTESSNDNLKYFEWVLYPYIVLSLLAVIFISEAIDPNFGTWRGLTPTKNNLGQVGLVGMIISATALKLGNFWKRFIAAAMFAISLLLLFGSHSMTSIVTAGFIAMIVLVLFIVKFVFPTPLIGRFLIAFMTIGFLLTIGSVIIYTPDALLDIPQYLGKSATFTGRDRIWLDIIEEINKHPFLGCGFSGFWVHDSDFLALFQKRYFWLPNQAHNGYLDILNETGIIGLSLVIMMVVKYLWYHSKIGTQDLWKWLVIATLIINTLETTLFRPRHLTGILFIFAYLAFYSDKRQSNHKHSIN